MIFRLFLKSEFWRFMGKNHPRIRVALKVRLFYAIFISNGSQKMTMESRKNQLNQVEMQGNKAQIVQGETGSRKMTMKFKKQIQNQSQSGRSMVEMLGVLAIIAILSIGGIVGYRLAMNYYQANQIAHEINLMRTDAQIKIAQGAEELTLGSPYDSGNIQFNGYKTNFDCLDMETETSTPDKVVSCAVANAYYIELQNIPEGICKPLANLIDKMDNEVAFYINGNSVDAAEGEKGACGEGNNALKVIFGADSDSNAVKCDTDPECASLENTPVCDTDRHVCVECTEEKGCEGEEHCENNVCKTCTDNRVWGGEENGCVECLTYENCTGKAETPQCDEISHTCKSCAEIDANKPLWADNECVECPKNQPWNGEFCGCRDNHDCDESSEFCLSSGCSDSCNESVCTQFECVKINDNDIVKGTINEKPYYGSVNGMNWWSAGRFCIAAASIEGKTGKLVSWNDINWQCYAEEDNTEIIPKPTNKESGYCKETSAIGGSSNISDTIKQLRSMYCNNDGSLDCNNKYVWLSEDDSSSCYAYRVYLQSGGVFDNYRYYDNRYALCVNK